VLSVPVRQVDGLQKVSSVGSLTSMHTYISMFIDKIIFFLSVHSMVHQLLGLHNTLLCILIVLLLLFLLTVYRINEVLVPPEDTSMTSLSSISVLDPIGSQGACQTSLHGLLSNYTEEVIQHLYYHKMFVWEQVGCG